MYFDCLWRTAVNDDFLAVFLGKMSYCQTIFGKIRQRPAGLGADQGLHQLNCAGAFD